MERISIQPRADWQNKVQKLGFEYFDASADGIYWDESTYYSFSKQEIDNIGYASETLFGLCLKAVDHIIANPELFTRFGIGEELSERIVESWNRDDPTLYGRFDLTIGKDGNYKMMEFNADTPTSLFEASIVQWFWKQDVFPNSDQYNSLHESLIEQWAYIQTRLPEDAQGVHFTTVPKYQSSEDFITTNYIRFTANEAGLQTRYLDIDQIGFDNEEHFVDNDGDIIDNLFKLYPWEWLVQEEFAPHAVQISTWIEPVWKMLLSNKAILPVLWKLFPNHPNLLPAYFADETHDLKDFVEKPILSREGSNIIVKRDGVESERTDGIYEGQPMIVQQLCPLPKFGDKYACIGSWIVGENAVGVGIRESEDLITKNSSHFVPHKFD